MKKCEIEIIIAEELDYYSLYLEECMFINKPFDYLDMVIDKYDKNKNEVYNRALDNFNYLMKNNVDEYQAKMFSIYKTHENILREVVK